MLIGQAQPRSLAIILELPDQASEEHAYSTRTVRKTSIPAIGRYCSESLRVAGRRCTLHILLRLPASPDHIACAILLKELAGYLGERAPIRWTLCGGWNTEAGTGAELFKQAAKLVNSTQPLSLKLECDCEWVNDETLSLF